MTGDEFRKCRHAANATQAKFGAALGYTGRNIGRQVRHYESGNREIPEWIARLADMYRRHGIPRDIGQIDQG